MKQTHPLKFIPYIIIWLLLIAIAHLPYWYYTFLRIVVFIYTWILAYNYLSDQKYSRWLVFGTIWIIYNPVFPIHLTKTIRIVINLLVATMIIIYLITENQKKKIIKDKCNELSEKQNIIEKFFEENPKVQKELEDEINSWQNKHNKNNSSTKQVYCATPHIQEIKEKIYDKYNQ